MYNVVINLCNLYKSNILVLIVYSGLLGSNSLVNVPISLLVYSL